MAREGEQQESLVLIQCKVTEGSAYRPAVAFAAREAPLHFRKCKSELADAHFYDRKYQIRENVRYQPKTVSAKNTSDLRPPGLQLSTNRPFC